MNTLRGTQHEKKSSARSRVNWSSAMESLHSANNSDEEYDPVVVNAVTPLGSNGDGVKASRVRHRDSSEEDDRAAARSIKPRRGHVDSRFSDEQYNDGAATQRKSVGAASMARVANRIRRDSGSDEHDIAPSAEHKAHHRLRKAVESRDSELDFEHRSSAKRPRAPSPQPRPQSLSTRHNDDTAVTAHTSDPKSNNELSLSDCIKQAWSRLDTRRPTAEIRKPRYIAPRNTESPLELQYYLKQSLRNNTWSLLMCLNPEKCADQCDVHANKRLHLVRILHNLRDVLYRLYNLHQKLKVAQQFVAPEDFEPLSSDETPLIALPEVNDAEIAALRDDPERLREFLQNIHGMLDSYLKIPVGCLIQCCDVRAVQDIDYFSSLNHALTPAELDNILDEIVTHGGVVKQQQPYGCGGEASSSAGGSNSAASSLAADNQRLKLRGTFLVSLQEINVVRGNYNFRKLVDVNNTIRPVIERFLHTKVCAEDSALKCTPPVYINIAMKRNTVHYQILDEATQQAGSGTEKQKDGVLGVVQLAYAEGNFKRGLAVNVKAYVVCTIGASADGLNGVGSVGGSSTARSNNLMYRN